MNSNSNIPATLDLAKSLKTFEESITQALVLTNVSQWDGRTIKDREQKIRQAALILAGQCIALLLHNLSQLSEAHETAAKQTWGWRHPRSSGHGRRWMQVLTLGNVLVPLWLPYVVERPARSKGERRKVRGQGFCPFLRWLSIEEGITPLLWSTIAQYGTISASFAIARETLKGWGITLSVKRIERLTYQFTKWGLSIRSSRLFHLRQGTLPTTPVLKDQRVVISVDGGRTRIRYAKKGKRRQKTNRHGYVGEWQEPKLLTIYVLDSQGKRVNNAELSVTNDGTFGDVEPFMELLEMHLVRLGINQAKQILLVADGAEWIWLRIPPVLQRLGCSPESIHQLLDFYHVTEHLQKFAEAAITQPKERQAWFQQARCNLKLGKIVDLLDKMQALRKDSRGERRSIMTSQIGYFTKGQQQGRLNYSHVAAQKLPIGSGAIESLIRQVVNLRLKGNGKFWLLENAEAMLHARCQWVAGTWGNFCDSILTATLYPA